MWVGKAKHVCLPFHDNRHGTAYGISSNGVQVGQLCEYQAIISFDPKCSHGPASTARNGREMRMQMRS